MELKDANGQILSFGDDENGNGHPKIIYSITKPCKSLINMYSNVYDIKGVSNVQAKKIEASNIIYNNAQATYHAEKYMVLKPGFNTGLSNGGFFKAEIRNCEN